MDLFSNPDHGAYAFNAVDSAPALSHIQTAPERPKPAPGQAGAGDIRSQRGAGGLAVLAQTPVGEGIGGAIAAPGAGAAAAAPGLVGDTGSAPSSPQAPALGGTGIHFVGGIPTPGLASAQAPGAAPAGFSPTSGPALVSGSNVIGAGGNPRIEGAIPLTPTNAVVARPPGGGSSTGTGRL